MDELAQALAGLAALKGEMERLSAELPGVLPVRIALPAVRPPIDQPPRRKETPPPWSPDEVFRRWRAEGPALLDAPSRRHISAIIAATAHPEVGPLLAREAVFVQGLAAIASPRQLVPALARMYFYAFPAHEHVHVALAAQLLGDGAGYAPLWARESTWHLAVAATAPRLSGWLGSQIATEPWTTLIQRWGLPDSLPNGPWAAPVVKAALIKPRDSDALIRAERLLRFADAGRILNEGAPIKLATALVIRWLVQLGEHTESHREQVMRLLHARVGDFFQVLAEARWRESGLDEQRGILKSWRVREVLDLVFSRLVPNNMSRHQTKERHEFWIQYQSRVDAIWVFAHGTLKARLVASDLHSLIEGGSLTVGELGGADQQAVVWMVLRGAGGQQVTVVEGNANTRWRIWPGGHPPENTDYLGYWSLGVMQRKHGGDDGVHSQNSYYGGGVWQPRVASMLREFGVTP